MALELAMEISGSEAPAARRARKTEATAIRGLRRRIIEVAAARGEGHIPSALSILDILWVLYDRVLNVTPATASAPERDRFVLSKGHASLGLYAVLAAKGF